jgi:hypothetical protein
MTEFHVTQKGEVVNLASIANEMSLLLNELHSHDVIRLLNELKMMVNDCTIENGFVDKTELLQFIERMKHITSQAVQIHS